MTTPTFIAPATALRLITVGPAPAATFASTTELLLATIAGATCSEPRASSRTSRVPEPSSRSTSGVLASFLRLIGLRLRAQG